MFAETTALKKILNLKRRIRAVSGGTGASKTISILCWIIDYCQSTKGELITIVAESVPHLKLGAIRDFKNIMIANKYWNDNLWNEMGIYSFESGSTLEFISFDKFGKAHGPRRDVLFINEANNIPYNIVDQLITRTRKIVWLDWNPIEDFWFYEEMLGKRDDIDFVGEGGNFPPLTYLDNEQLDESSRKEIEIHKNNKQWWDIYGLGKRGALEGKIYKDWRIVNEIPPEARLERYGLDFGYSNDPTAIVAIYYYNGGYILEEKLYRKGMSNKDIANFFQSIPEKLIIADSAEPKSIDELRSYGLNVSPAQKGKDSVRQGIQLIQDQPISMTKNSVNLIKEYRGYLWTCDKNGKILNIPQDFQNHLCFAKGTMVGNEKIEDVGTQTGIKDVYEYEIAGQKLVATPNHPVLTQRGLVDIDALRYNDVIWQRQKLLYTQVSGGIGIRQALGALIGFTTTAISRIIEARSRDYIDSYGKKKTVKSLRGIIFITRTAIPLIISLITWSLYTAVNTCLSIGLRKSVSGLKRISKRLLTWPLNGLKLQLAGNEGKNLDIPTSIFYSIGQLLNGSAIYAGKNTGQKKQNEVDFATITAVKKHYVGREPVYSLRTKSGMFPANGIMVSNCDALRYAMSTMARVEPPKTYWDRIWKDELEGQTEKPLPNLGR